MCQLSSNLICSAHGPLQIHVCSVHCSGREKEREITLLYRENRAQVCTISHYTGGLSLNTSLPLNHTPICYRKIRTNCPWKKMHCCLKVYTGRPTRLVGVIKWQTNAHNVHAKTILLWHCHASVPVVLKMVRWLDKYPQCSLYGRCTR